MFTVIIQAAHPVNFFRTNTEFLNMAGSAIVTRPFSNSTLTENAEV